MIKVIAALVALATACSSKDDEGGGGGGAVSGQAEALLGIWVSEDVPDTTWVLELLVHDPYHDALSGQSQVYRIWHIADGGEAEPELQKYGKFSVVEGNKLQTEPVWSKISGEPLLYHNEIFEHEGDRLVIASGSTQSGRRTLKRVATFPGSADGGGGFGGGDRAAAETVEPTSRKPLAERPGGGIGQLFRTGANEALALRGATSFAGSINESTTIFWSRSGDGGTSWDGEMIEGYAVTEARFKEQSHGRPLVYPNNSLSEYLYLWNPTTKEWAKDNDIQICRESVGFDDQDIVLTSRHGLAYSICIGDSVMIHRRAGPSMLRLEHLPGGARRVAGQWMPGDSEHGTLYVLLMRGLPQEEDFVIFAHDEVPGVDFDTTGLDAPAATITADCGAAGAGARCEIVDLVRYFVRGKVHHIVATAKLAGLARAHPLADEPRLALHIHGELGGAFETEVLNLREAGGEQRFYGNVVDVDIPRNDLEPGEPETLFATLQDCACLRVLSSPVTAVDWASIGVVPTYHRPQHQSVVVWDETRLGMVSTAPAFEYLSFDIVADEARCPPPRVVSPPSS